MKFVDTDKRMPLRGEGFGSIPFALAPVQPQAGATGTCLLR